MIVRRHIIGVNIENFATDQVGKQQSVLQLRDSVITINQQAGSGTTVLQNRIGMVPLYSRIGHTGISSWIAHVDHAVFKTVAGFPGVPAQVATSRYRTDFLNDVLTDFGQVHHAGIGIPDKVLGITNAVGINFIQSTVVANKRVVGGNAVFTIGAVIAKWIDAQHFAED